MINLYFTKNSIFLILITISFFSIQTSAQIENLPPPDIIETAPQWAKSMYGENPNFYNVERQYNDYYRENDFQKNTHTRYYKFWKKAVQNRIDSDGFIIPVSSLTSPSTNNLFTNRESSSGSWSLIGPVQNHGLDSTLSAYQANVYCIDQSFPTPILFFVVQSQAKFTKALIMEKTGLM